MTAHLPASPAPETALPRRWLTLPRVLGLLVLALGLEVMAGWLLQVQAMVEIRHGLVAMVFNTALCFALSGVALVLPGWRRPLRWLPRAIGLLLFGLCGLILIEHVYDLSLGIDWAFLHTWLQDGNTRPGRLAPNTAIGFMLAGVCLMLLGHMTSRGRERLFQVAVFCLLAVGLTGLIGYMLSPEQLFGWPRSARMALHTASGMIVLSLALWSAGQQQSQQQDFLSEEERIGFMSAAVMCMVALVAGLTGFVLSQSILDVALRQPGVELYGVIRSQLLWLMSALLLLLTLGSMVMRWQLKPLVQRLRASEAHAREQQLEINTVLESVGEGILTINEAGVIESFNLAAAVIFGYEAQQVIGQPVTMLMPEEFREAHSDGMARYMKTGVAHVIGRPGVEMVGLHQNGNRFTLELTVNEIQLEARRIFVGVVRDITERKRTEEKLIFLAQYDVLTGLPNRALFMDRLSGAILRASRSRTALAVMFLDLDGFKAVNDTLGHHSGDDLLRKFAERLSMAVRKSDSVARLAGDEFTVILEGMTQPERDTREVADKIIAAMQHQFELGTHRVRVTTSIGLAIHEGGEADLNELLRRADDAMYRAKQLGKNCWCS